MIYMVLAIGDARTYQGNLGYEDDPKRLYVFDSTVPNSNRVSPGDVFVVVDPHSVVGIGVVESIFESKETKNASAARYADQLIVGFEKR